MRYLCSLPNADGAKDAKTIAPGTVAYAGNNGSANAVQATEDGGAVILDGNNQFVAHIDKPWAKDANGVMINTYFSTDGLMLTQHIDHKTAKLAYPITADPQIGFGWYVYIRLSPSDQRFIVNGGASAESAFTLAKAPHA